MPDKINVLKICAILAVGAISLNLAAGSAENYAVKTASGEKTLAEAIMQNKLREELEKAGEKLEQELEKQQVTIVTTSMETRPPVTKPPETEPPVTETSAPGTSAEPPESTAAAETLPVTEPPASETEQITTTTTTTAAPEETTVPQTEAEEEIITEFTRGGLLPTDRRGIPFRTLFGLSQDEQDQVIGFLIDHYFLDGFVYSANETRPKLKEKKYFAAQIENNVIESFNLIITSVNISDFAATADADFGAIRQRAEELRDDLRDNYADAEQYGEQYKALYDESLKYFDRLVTALGRVENTMEQYKNTANPLLAMGLLATALGDVVIPEIMAVLEQSFDLVEITQEIYLEGTQGTRLLSRDEVRSIVENPGIALYVIKNGLVQ